MDKQNVVYPYNGVLSIFKSKGILTYTRTWIKLGDIMLSDYIKSKKEKYHMIPFI